MAHGGLPPLIPLRRYPIGMRGMDPGYSERPTLQRETRS